MNEKPNPFRARRIHLGYTQAGLAAACEERGAKVGDSQISKIERGISVPYPPLRKALREILGDDPVDLQPQPEPKPETAGAGT